jgi:hypothetical protein
MKITTTCGIIGGQQVQVGENTRQKASTSFLSTYSSGLQYAAHRLLSGLS